MRGVADVVREWTGLGRAPVVARLVELHGFGGRRADEALVVAGDERAGTLLGGAADLQVAEAASGGLPKLLRVRLGDDEAVDHGLACGGQASVLVERVDDMAPGFWDAVGADEPVALVTAIRDDQADGTRLVTTGGATGTTGDAALDDLADEEAIRLLRAGRSTTTVVETEEARAVLEVIVPPTHLAVVGQADLAEALQRQCELLGWRVTITDDVTEAVRLASALATHDALVVLSHDPAVDTPALRAGLVEGRGYVGALGSRGTQSARRRRLADLGVAPIDLDRIHGPVGLDLGTRTPEETSVAIVAEILAHRSGRVPASLRGTDGPING